MFYALASFSVFTRPLLRHVQLHGFTLEPNPTGDPLESSFSPDGQFVLSGEDCFWVKMASHLAILLESQ